MEKKMETTTIGYMLGLCWDKSDLKQDSDIYTKPFTNPL